MRPTYRAAVAAAAAALAWQVLAPAPAALAAEEQWWHTQWRMDEVWSITDGTGATVAVIDTGVDASVPELDGAVVPGLDFRDPAGDGRVDRDTEEGGHGTGMAVLIAGNGRAGGLRGVAPAATILPIVRSRSSVVGLDQATDDLAQAIRWAVDEGADVINMSFGMVSTRCPEELADATRYAFEQDVLLVSAVGNHRGSGGDIPGVCPGVLAIGANDAQLEPWEDTARGDFVHLTAPGVELRAAGAGGATGVSSGTSNSAALVSGVIGLLRAQFPEESAEQTLSRLFATARDIHTSGRDDATGYGVVRPYHALTEPALQQVPDPVVEIVATTAAPAATTDPGPLVTPAGQPDALPDRDGGMPAWLAGVAAFAGVVLVVLAVALIWIARTRRS